MNGQELVNGLDLHHGRVFDQEIDDMRLRYPNSLVDGQDDLAAMRDPYLRGFG